MKKTFVLGIASLALAGLAAAETHRITLFQPSVVNGKQLKPGDYKLELKDNKMTLSRGKETVTADVKVEQGDSKFPSTAIRYLNGDGNYKVSEIRLGGSKTKLTIDGAKATVAE